jgi:hypothetical protein
LALCLASVFALVIGIRAIPRAGQREFRKLGDGVDSDLLMMVIGTEE